MPRERHTPPPCRACTRASLGFRRGVAAQPTSTPSTWRSRAGATARRSLPSRSRGAGYSERQRHSAWAQPSVGPSLRGTFHRLSASVQALFPAFQGWVVRCCRQTGSSATLKAVSALVLGGSLPCNGMPRLFGPLGCRRRSPHHAFVAPRTLFTLGFLGRNPVVSESARKITRLCFVS